MKFSCSFDESEHYVDSCGSAESEQSDSEQEVEAEVDNNMNAEYHYVDVHVNNEDEEEYDIQVGIYYFYENNSSKVVKKTSSSNIFLLKVAEDGYEDLEEHHEMLRVEVALAQKELLEYERTMNNKRRKTYIIKN